MRYCTLREITDHIPEVNLIELTDDENIGVVNEGRVNEAILYADTLIDSYLQGRYNLPLNPIPQLVKKLSIDLAVYHLYSRRFELAIPEGMKERYKNCIKILEHIQKGIIRLGVETEMGPGEGYYMTNKKEEDRLFNKNCMKTY